MHGITFTAGLNAEKSKRMLVQKLPSITVSKKITGSTLSNMKAEQNTECSKMSIVILNWCFLQQTWKGVNKYTHDF